MEKDYLQSALAHFNTDIPQWYGWRKDWNGEKRMSYENLILNDNTATMPSKAEVDAKIEELKQNNPKFDEDINLITQMITSV